MIEVHLIGYTDDGEQLVLDLDADGAGRYALTIDPDLLATVEALRAVRVARGAPVDARTPPPARAAQHAPAPPTARPARPVVPEGGRLRSPAATGPEGPDAVGPEGPDAAGPGAPDATGPEGPDAAGPGAPGGAGPEGPEVGTVGPAGPTDGATVPSTGPEPAAPPEAPEHTGWPAPRSALSPAEIQRELRAGRSVARVAEAAGVDAAWIERWLPPILAERQRILDDAWQRAVGTGRDPLRAQVEAVLAARSVPTERVVWTTARRADGRWSVSVRFPEDRRSRSATWTMRPDGGPLAPASPLARELTPTSQPAARASRRSTR